MVAPAGEQPRHRAHVGGGEVSSMTRKTKQPRLLPRLEPIAETDALTLADLTTRYRCRCGNTAETAIKLDAVICTRCGNAMLPITTHERKRNDERNRPND